MDRVDVQLKGSGATGRIVAPAEGLPAPLSGLIGRGAERREILDLLDRDRLITLSGPAGCGKTRLALDVALVARAGFAGASWIELAGLHGGAVDPGVPAVVRWALGAHGQPDEDDLDVVIRHLVRQRHLLVLDNCEHVVTASAELVHAVLRACPDVVVLTTSRQPLGVPGEVTWRVPPLSTPPRPAPGAAIDVAVVERAEAVALFVDRARRVRPSFAVDEENAAALAEIAVRLDGLPLAIELAASRVRVLSPMQIAAALGRRFELLTGGPPLAEGHHRTLEASIEWSHALLDDAEQAVLRRLSVFAGGFTVEAASVVVADGIEEAGVVDLVERLVDRSLVQVVGQGGPELRFGLLETIRAYAAERLDESGERDRVRDRHLTWALELAHRAEPELTGAEQRTWLDRLEADHQNLIYALSWARGRGSPSVALALCADLALFWVLHGHYREAVAELDRVLALGGGGEGVRPRARWALAYVYLFAGDHRVARSHADAALEGARAVDDRATAARALNVIGMIELYAMPASARPTMEEAISLARSTEDEWCLSDGLCLLGTSWVALNRFEEGEPAIAEAFAIAARRGDAEHLAWNGHARQLRALRRGDLGEADRWYAEAIDLAGSLGDPTILAALRNVRVETLILRGCRDEAAAMIRSSLADLEERGAAHLLPALWAQQAIAGLDGDAAQVSAALDRLRAESDVEARVLHLAFAEAACRAGDPDRGVAGRAASAALEIARWIDDPWATAEHLRLSGLAALPDDPRRAESLVHEALAIADEHGFEPSVTCCLDVLGAAGAARSLDLEAARLFGAAAASYARVGMVRPTPGRRVIEDLQTAMGDRLSAEALATAVSEGARLSLADAVSHARRTRGARGRPRSGWASLTPTEERVVALVCEGFTNPRIAAQLFVSAGTVKSHLSHIYRKLGLATRSELAAAATLRLIGTGPTAGDAPG